MPPRRGQGCGPLRGAACHPSDGSSEVGLSVGCAHTRAMARRRSAARRPRRLKPPTSANPMPAHGNATLTSATSYAPAPGSPSGRCTLHHQHGALGAAVTFTRAPAGASGPSACHSESPTRTLPRPFWIACSTTSERPMYCWPRSLRSGRSLWSRVRAHVAAHPEYGQHRDHAEGDDLARPGHAGGQRQEADDDGGQRRTTGSARPAPSSPG